MNRSFDVYTFPDGSCAGRWAFGFLKNDLAWVKNALCVDGVRRTVRVTGPDTDGHGWKASVSVRGHTVSGWVRAYGCVLPEGYRFTANPSGRNADLLTTEGAREDGAHDARMPLAA